MGFDPQRTGWPCTSAGSCDGTWFRIGDALVCQCRHRRCRRVIAVVAAVVLPEPVPRAVPSGMWDPSLSTDLRPADDWPGCRD